jgi:oxygen-independent coproporphyrinogen III oxidase
MRWLAIMRTQIISRYIDPNQTNAGADGAENYEQRGNVSPRKGRAMLNRNVPRYTSYPTAPHFTASVGAETYASWLKGLGSAATLSLYLHVPYCAQLCLYCGCHTKVTLRRAPIEAYAMRLAREIALVAGFTGRRRVTHLHWGGGTPSILGVDGLRALHAALAQAFDIDPTGEHAIELDPRHVTPALAAALADIGVDRASLGVQDLNESVQRAIGRIQPFAVVKDAVAMLAKAGITKINFDLMYGLPRQTVDDVRATIAQVHTLSPSRLAVFGYAHVPWMKAQQRLIESNKLPGFAERQAQAAAAHQALCGLGYRPIGLDHYARADEPLTTAARAGRLHRNFQGYTTDAADALIGLGASAIGRLPQGYVQNAADIAGYSRAIDQKRLATVKGIALSADDRLRAHVIERLMCDLSVDLDALAAAAGVHAESYFAEELESLIPFTRDRLLDIAGRRIRVTEKGRPFVRILAATFDTYLRQASVRHSLAV